MRQREQNKADKQQRIEAAGLAAFLRDGYERASIERIAAEADVARGTFYLYFDDKETLFAALIDRFIDPLLASMTEAGAALSSCQTPDAMLPVYAQLGASLMTLFLGHRDEVRLFFHESRAMGAGGDAARARSRQAEALTRQILTTAVRRHLLRTHDVHITALAIVGAIERIVWGYLEGDRNIRLAQVAEEVTNMMRNGLLIR